MENENQSVKSVKEALADTCPKCKKDMAFFTWSIRKPFKRTRQCRFCGEQTRMSLGRWLFKVIDELFVWF